MVPLQPGVEPPELTNYIAGHEHAGPDEFEKDPDFQDAKDAIKSRRNAEQFELCVYCEQLLGPTAGHVEHVHPKRGPHANALLTFAYGNLAQSCQGYHKDEKKRHCGDAKGNLLLAVTPGPGCNESFVLHDDGIIAPDRANPTPGLNPDDLEKQVNDTLRLNLKSLKIERKRVVDAIRLLTAPERPVFLRDQPFRFIVQRFPDFAAPLPVEAP